MNSNSASEFQVSKDKDGYLFIFLKKLKNQFYSDIFPVNGFFKAIIKWN